MKNNWLNRILVKIMNRGRKFGVMLVAILAGLLTTISLAFWDNPGQKTRILVPIVFSIISFSLYIFLRLAYIEELVKIYRTLIEDADKKHDNESVRMKAEIIAKKTQADMIFLKWQLEKEGKLLTSDNFYEVVVRGRSS